MDEGAIVGDRAAVLGSKIFGLCPLNHSPRGSSLGEVKETGVFDEKSKAELLKALEGLTGQVRIVYFTKKEGCPSCAAQAQLLQELSALSEKFSL